MISYSRENGFRFGSYLRDTALTRLGPCISGGIMQQSVSRQGFLTSLAAAACTPSAAMPPPIAGDDERHLLRPLLARRSDKFIAPASANNGAGGRRKEASVTSGDSRTAAEPPPIWHRFCKFCRNERDNYKAPPSGKHHDDDTRHSASLQREKIMRFSSPRAREQSSQIGCRYTNALTARRPRARDSGC